MITATESDVLVSAACDAAAAAEAAVPFPHFLPHTYTHTHTQAGLACRAVDKTRRQQASCQTAERERTDCLTERRGKKAGEQLTRLSMRLLPSNERETVCVSFA